MIATVQRWSAAKVPGTPAMGERVSMKLEHRMS